MSLGQKYFIGIDSGSTMCKLVLMAGRQVIDREISKTGWNPRQSASDCLDSILARQRQVKRDELIITATGYGREVIDFAGHVFTEISCHAYGGMYLVPQIQGIIDIGGQDSKVIHLQNKRVVNFLMNDKCAAGTGRFLSMACDALGISLGQIDDFVHPDQAIAVNSMCTVFAESEIVGLLSMQKDRSMILRGVLESIAQRIRQMAGRVDFESSAQLLMTGGLAASQAMVETLAAVSTLNIRTHELASFTGAIGACVLAADREALN